MVSLSTDWIRKSFQSPLGLIGLAITILAYSFIFLFLPLFIPPLFPFVVSAIAVALNIALVLVAFGTFWGILRVIHNINTDSAQ